jgi:hypothetical protein
MNKISELFKKKEPTAGPVASGDGALFGETRPDYQDRINDANSDTIVRLVSSRKDKKPYQVKGIDDVGCQK